MSTDSAEYRPNHTVDRQQKADAKRRVMAETHLVTDGPATDRIIRIQEHDNGQIYVDGYSPDSNQTPQS